MKKEDVVKNLDVILSKNVYYINDLNLKYKYYTPEVINFTLKLLEKDVVLASKVCQFYQCGDRKEWELYKYNIYVLYQFTIKIFKSRNDG